MIYLKYKKIKVMDRIEINGFWYVKEDTISKEEDIELNPIHSEEITVENSDFCFIASRMFKDDKESYYDVDIKFTDKRIKVWKEEYWDNINFIKGVLENDPVFLKELPDFTTSQIKYFKAFLQYLKDKNWL